MAPTSLALTSICRTSIVPASTIGVQGVLRRSAIKMLSATRSNSLHHTVSTFSRRSFSPAPIFQPNTRPLSTCSLLSQLTTLSTFTNTIATRTFYSPTRTRTPKHCTSEQCTYTADKAAAAEKSLRDAHVQLRQYLTKKHSRDYAFQIESAYSRFATGKSIAKNIAEMKGEEARKVKHEKQMVKLAQAEKEAIWTIRILIWVVMAAYVGMICYSLDAPEGWWREKLGWQREKVHTG